MTLCAPAAGWWQNRPMAIYHLSVKPVQRSAGRSSTAAAAYRAGKKIIDERTGEIHDYRRKSGVEDATIILPPEAPGWAANRAALWNAAEAAEKRKDGTPAREYVVALPAELNAEQRRTLAHQFAADMAAREGCAVDVCIHAPGKDGDERNHHAHILRTTRQLGPEGLGAKLDTERAGRDRKADLAAVRQRWAELANAALEHAGHAARIDHRSHADAAIEAVPTRHHGPTVTAIERRRRGASRVVQAQQQARQAIQKAAEAAKTGGMGQEVAQLEKSLQEAKNERQRHQKQAQDQADRTRWQAMTPAELDAERQRYARAAQQARAASQPSEHEQHLAKAAQRAAAELAQASARADAAQRAAADWPERHRLRMKLGADGPLRELRAEAKEAVEVTLRAQHQDMLASREHEHARRDRLEAAEMPHRLKEAEVRSLMLLKKEQERKSQQEAAHDLAAAKRLANVLEKGPSAKGWPTLPPKLRELAERVHAEIPDRRQRGVALERVAANVVKTVGREQVSELSQAAERAARGRDHGLSR